MYDRQIDQLISEHRLERAHLFLTLCGVTWGTFGLYFFMSGRVFSCTLCLIVVAIAFLIVNLLPKVDKLLLLHVFVGVSLLGITIESLTSGQRASDSPYFLCCMILFAAHQLGAKAALQWTAGVIVCLLLVHFGFRPGTIPEMRTATPLDNLLTQIGITLFVAAFSVFSEISVRRNARSVDTISQELKDQTCRLNEIVAIDSLTGLANRHQLHNNIEAAIERARERDQTMAVFLIDLDGFKSINDTMGHATGDEVLRIVADRLRESVDHTSQITRLGGDEFTVIVESPKNELDLIVTGGNIVRSVSRELEIDGRQLDMGASVGIAIYPRHAETSDKLLSLADAAMYEAKARRCGVRIFEQKMLDHLERKRDVDLQLRRCLARNEFSLFYQPQVNIASGKIIGMESLLRWNNNGEYVLPSEFIPQLESSRFIVDVGRWILNESCRQARSWQQKGYNLSVSVNVSAVQFHHGSFIDTVWDAIESNGLDPSLLDIELTETVLVDDTPNTISKIDILRESGVSISIDDFGTGYSSLAYLKVLPINRLKIDRSFVKDIPDNDDGMIAATVISLAHNLGMTVVAEGVDSEAQLEFLRKHGCEDYQGYYFSKPLDPVRCESLLVRQLSPLVTARLERPTAHETTSQGNATPPINRT